MRTWDVVMIAAMAMGCDGAEEQGARENAELDRRVKARLQAEDEAREKRRSAESAMDKELRQRDTEAADEKSRMIQQYAKFSPSGREFAMREACANGCIGHAADAVIEAAPASEREALRKLKAELEAKSQIASREKFADSLDEALLAKRLNPDGVSAIGRDKAELRIKGWFCSRQFMHDFTSGDLGRTAAGMGFKKLRCDGPDEWFSQEL